MQPFDLEVFFGERVTVLGSNGSGKSHFLRPLAAGGAGRGRRWPRPGPLRAGQSERAGLRLAVRRTAGQVPDLLLELSGAPLLLLDEPTDNLDLHSAEALEHALDAFTGTVLAVTHDRWFARGLDRHLVFGADGQVFEFDQPVWDETRVRRTR